MRCTRRKGWGWWERESHPNSYIFMSLARHSLWHTNTVCWTTLSSQGLAWYIPMWHRSRCSHSLAKRSHGRRRLFAPRNNRNELWAIASMVPIAKCHWDRKASVSILRGYRSRFVTGTKKNAHVVCKYQQSKARSMEGNAWSGRYGKTLYIISYSVPLGKAKETSKKFPSFIWYICNKLHYDGLSARQAWCACSSTSSIQSDSSP